MTPDQIEAERKLFEAAYIKNYPFSSSIAGKFIFHEHGNYEDTSVNVAWVLWQARAALNQPQSEPVYFFRSIDGGAWIDATAENIASWRRVAAETGIEVFEYRTLFTAPPAPAPALSELANVTAELEAMNTNFQAMLADRNEWRDKARAALPVEAAVAAAIEAAVKKLEQLILSRGSTWDNSFLGGIERGLVLATDTIRAIDQADLIQKAGKS